MSHERIIREGDQTGRQMTGLALPIDRLSGHVGEMMRQVVYISSLNFNRCKDGDFDLILNASRRNNSRDEVSGLLFFNGRRFLQALEGGRSAIGGALLRIENDPRHRAMVMLSDREVTEREFGNWAMAHLAQGSLDAHGALAQIDLLVSRAAPSVRSTFQSFVRLAIGDPDRLHGSTDPS